MSVNFTNIAYRTVVCCLMLLGLTACGSTASVDNTVWHSGGVSKVSAMGPSAPIGP